MTVRRFFAPCAMAHRCSFAVPNIHDGAPSFSATLSAPCQRCRGGSSTLLPPRQPPAQPSPDSARAGSPRKHHPALHAAVNPVRGEPAPIHGSARPPSLPAPRSLPPQPSRGGKTRFMPSMSMPGSSASNGVPALPRRPGHRTPRPQNPVARNPRRGAPRIQGLARGRSALARLLCHLFRIFRPRLRFGRCFRALILASNSAYRSPAPIGSTTGRAMLGGVSGSQWRTTAQASHARSRAL